MAGGYASRHVPRAWITKREQCSAGCAQQGSGREAEEARQREGATADASRGFAGEARAERVGEKARPAREVSGWGGGGPSTLKTKKVGGPSGAQKGPSMRIP
jgi:hypothetical protein